MSRYFAMIELIVVMAILSVMMLIAVPAVTRINVDSLDSYCERIASLFEAARNQAMLTGTPTVVKVDPVNRTIYGATAVQKKESEFTIESPEGELDAFSSNIVLPEWIFISIESPPEKLSFKFYPDGTASIPRITLQEEQNYRYITVRPLTGRVNIDTIKR